MTRHEVEKTDVVSPTIVERLRSQAGVVQPMIDDWRAMVDSIMDLFSKIRDSKDTGDFTAFMSYRFRPSEQSGGSWRVAPEGTPGTDFTKVGDRPGLSFAPF